jgi:hypothetical protein
LSFETEILSFETSGECDWIQIELEDGSILVVKPYIAQIARIGNDPGTGAPVYAVGTSYQLRYQTISKKQVSFPEFIKFKTDKECPWIEVKIEDGSILRVKPNIVYISRIGSDPFGTPQYMIQIQAAIQVVKIPKELIRKPIQKTSMHT